MKSLIEMIKNNPDALYGNGASEDDIAISEEILNLTFSEEYREYLSVLSIAAIDGRELTGLSKTKRVNVVSVTSSQRKLNPQLPEDMYVIEEANIDGIVVWQNETGAVFHTSPGMDTKKVADSIVEYLGN